MLININLGIISITNIDVSALLNKLKVLLNKSKTNTIRNEYMTKLRNIKRQTVKRRTIYNFDEE